MLPSPARHRPDRAIAGAVCLAGGTIARERERGAVLVHVAVAMMGLLAFAALSIDLGAVWVARAQVQNAADAAALSGGVALAYASADPDEASAAAQVVAQQHSVWGNTLSAGSIATAVGPCPTGSPAVSGDCMAISITPPPLPVFFSRIFGALPTTVSATASAKVLLGNAATCPRPLAMPDRWVDTYDETPPIDAVWTDDEPTPDLYARYNIFGVPNIPPASADSYVQPSAAGPGSGLTVAYSRGRRVTRRLIDTTAGLPLAANALLTLDLPRPGGHPAATYRYSENLGSCSGVPMSIGATVATVHPPAGYYTTTPLINVINSDPGAEWDDASQSIRGSAQPVSPRLIAVALIDPETFTHQDRSGGRDPDVVVRNIVGFFLEEAWESGGVVRVRGVITPMAGGYDASAPSITDLSTFLRTVALVR